jgi:hypothetical protein
VKEVQLMVLAYSPAQFEEILDFMVSAPSPEAIVAFKPSAELEARLSELMAKNKQDTLTDDERDELQAFLQLNHLMNMLKIRARQKLAADE